MKTGIRIAVFVALVTMCAGGGYLGGCSEAAASASASRQRWEFVQSVGGIRVSHATRNESGAATLYLDCDVSGLKEITTKPTRVNSGIVCIAPEVEIAGGVIYVEIRTALPSVSWKSAECPPVDLGKIPSGAYEVRYKGTSGDPHRMGTVMVP